MSETQTTERFEVYNCQNARWSRVGNHSTLEEAVAYAEACDGPSVVSTWDAELNETVHWRSA